MAPPSPRIEPGTVLGPYVVDRRLAQGGMSVLYLAHDEQQRPLVLKIIPDEIATAAARARLSREARALASVEHSGVVRVYGSGEYQGIPWIAMEYVRGTDLKRLLADRGAVAAERALRWIAQAAEGLTAAHDAGVIHRDLKPSNLLVTEGGDQIKIVDFGIAKRRTEVGGDVLTSPREVIGTPAYLAPEQLEHGLADERSDVWALGCVLYELVVGTPPFGRGANALTAAAILRDEPTFPPHVAAAVIHVVSGCLRKNSFARIGSARELAALARDALGGAAEDAGARRSLRLSAAERVGASEGYDSAGRLSAPPPRPSAPPPRPSEPPRARSNSRLPPAEPLAPRSVRTSAAPPAPRSSGKMRASASIPLGASASPARPERPATARSSAAQPSARPPRPDLRGAERSARPPAVGRLKGTAARAGLLWYGTTYGDSTLAAVYDRASANLKAILRANEPAFGVIASGWYDVQLMGELLEVMEQVVAGEDVEAYTNALTTAIAKDNVGGIYRSLFRLITTPKMLEANIQRVWRTYMDEGTLAMRAPVTGQLHAEITGWTRHHPTVCRVIGAMMQNVLRAVGYGALIMERSTCVSEGDPSCTFEGLYLV